MRYLPLSTLLVGLGGCILAQPRHGEAEVRALEHRMAVHRRQVGQAEEQSRRLRLLAQQVLASYGRARQEWERARLGFEKARATFDQASQGFTLAAAAFHDAAKNYQRARNVVLFAGLVEGLSLCGAVSTHQYRRNLERQGVDLSSVDIDHVFPRSLGGADHPWNYQELDSSVNRSLGNAFGLAKCVNAGVDRCAQAAVVSLLCGRLDLVVTKWLLGSTESLPHDRPSGQVRYTRSCSVSPAPAQAPSSPSS